MHQELKEEIARAYAENRDIEADRDVTSTLMVGSPPKNPVTLENLMKPPANRWSFRNLGMLVPNLTISNGNGPQSTLPVTIDRSVLGIEFDSFTEERVSVSQHLAATYTDAFLVIKDGVILSEYYYNGQDDHSRHIMFSVTKSLTGTLAEMLVSQGLLDPDQSAESYVPELAGSAFADATVRQIMDMSVGIEYSEAYDDPNSSTIQLLSTFGMAKAVPGARTFESVHKWVASFKKLGNHGGFFDYVTATTEALGWVMASVTGKPIDQLFETIWGKLGCERDGYILADKTGLGMSGGGFNATLRDIGRFGQMMLNHGEFNNQIIIPRQVVETIKAGNPVELFATNHDFWLWAPNASYKSQWYVFNDEAIMAVGIHGQWIYIDYKSNLVVVKQSSSPCAVYALDLDTVKMMRSLGAYFQ